MKFCKCHISKSINDENVKLVIMREVFDEIFGEKYFLVIALFDILDIANAIPRKV